MSLLLLLLALPGGWWWWIWRPQQLHKMGHGHVTHFFGSKRLFFGGRNCLVSQLKTRNWGKEGNRQQRRGRRTCVAVGREVNGHLAADAARCADDDGDGLVWHGGEDADEAIDDMTRRGCSCRSPPPLPSVQVQISSGPHQSRAPPDRRHRTRSRERAGRGGRAD